MILQISKPEFNEFDTFCSNPNLFLSNINDLNPGSSTVIGDFNARISKWWSSNKETFKSHVVPPANRSTYSHNQQFLLLH